MRNNANERNLEPLQLELNNLAHWLRHTGRRLVVLFEGRDTAGKGGCISAIAETFKPRRERYRGPVRPIRE